MESPERPHASGPPRVAGGVFALIGPDPSLVADCIHCGFCLPSCPTYVLWGEEMDSPRGRIDLMRQGISGTPLSDSMLGHFDACLGCMACVTACPSGVRYDRLIEDTRAALEQAAHRPTRERLVRAAIFAVFPHRRRLAPLAGLLRARATQRLLAVLRRADVRARLPQFVNTLVALAPRPGAPEQIGEHASAVSAERGRVVLLRGCVQAALFPGVNAATVRVLNAEGFAVAAPEALGCCGALAAHAGRRSEAIQLARAAIDLLERSAPDPILVNAAGCGSALKEYGELLGDDPAYARRAAAVSARVRDIAEFLAAVEPVAPRHAIAARVAYHDACHLAHAQGVRAAPRSLLADIPGIELVELGESELCCGSAGIYNLLQPGPATALGDRKATSVLASGAEFLVSANPGCTMQIGAALARRDTVITTLHTVELLDASIRGVRPSESR